MKMELKLSALVLFSVIVITACGGGGASPVTANPASITVAPSGKFAYTANWGSNNISVYAIDATTGALTAKTAVAAGTNPVSIAVDPSGKFAYAANWGSNNISVYTIAADGALTPAGTAVAAGKNPNSIAIAVNLSGKFAYAANWTSNDISVYTITATGPLAGALTTGTAVVAGTNPASVAVAPSTVTPLLGEFVYAANETDSTISVYKIDTTTGALQRQ